ncbi:MAG: DegT/DnrJ/EryC1/StrS family aminotransferase [Cytophagales bacterium]|nr:DegT/DnrJ/EryC1/StrS family aminotransferase [Cytophagales bacterium]MCA6369582.1 DegT/DnrJ/EryC1/StrS family aminotransferase [Cytophagales bacterium]MCA6370704.1 DegT/DnrJ/EryC1/StrS family aminotransferase [Cytophagales bacterium]MCA6377114.1 DegT/DnrJ/EryC1/StrS family aminotransferase [Cytophagales bacterium]MCA6383767.1 DegT/DnrJ/EryC1/StrS family aminotransferase [Cytophagales bacterium]
MQKIQMVDLRSQYLRIKTEIDSAIESVLQASAFIQGPEVKEFAQALSIKNQNAHVVPCANGTDALQIAMMALDLKHGDEVILPVHTYVATAEVIALLGLVPVFIDVDANTFNIDVDQIESKITTRTKAIVPVHLYGQCADMEPILRIAKDHNLFVIEDVAQALGAEYTFANGTVKNAGTMGIIGTTSFFPSKNLGAYGDGGAIFTRDSVLAEKMAMIASHGQKVKYHHDVIGINSRLDTLQAAILNVKLKYLHEYTHKRNEAANFYDNELTSCAFLKIPKRAEYSTHVFHQYTLKAEGINRDDFKKYLEGKGIPSMIYYPVPLHLQKAYQRPGFGIGSFPVTEQLSKTVISLPIHTEMTSEELVYICQTVKEYPRHA